MKYLYLLLFLFISLKDHAQISIIQDEGNDVKKEFICKYDSMSNFLPQKEEDGFGDGYRHLKGQTIMFCGDPWKEHYNAPKLTIGDYFYIKDIQIYKNSSLKKYCVFTIENTKTKECTSFDCYTGNFNELWVVLGYYEKQKSIYVGKEYVCRNTSELYPFDSNTQKDDINSESVWKCIDVSVKYKTDEKIWRYRLCDDRSCVVLVFENPEYGKYYCYLEDGFGTHYSIYNRVIKDYDGFSVPMICGMFQEKTAYDKMISKKMSTELN